MATVNKDFKIKNGLIVEGANGTINGYDILTKDAADQSYIVGLVGGSANSESVANAIVLRDANANFAANVITADLVGDVTGQVSDISNFDTDDLAEGNNLYFSNARAQDALAGMYDPAGSANTAYNNAISYADGLAVNYDPAGSASTAESNANGYTDTHAGTTSGIHGVTGNVVGTSDTQTLTNKTIGDDLIFVDGANGENSIEAVGNNLVVTSNSGSVILVAGTGQHSYIGSSSEGNRIATAADIDAATAGLSWKPAVNLLAHTNIALTGNATTTSIDGHSLSSADGYRVLLTGQTTDSEKGIYSVDVTSGTYTFTRSSDADQFGELKGAAVFIMEGTTYGQTSWVQSNHYLTDFTSQDWVQFSGTGSVTAGTGIIVDGLEVSVDTNVIATVSYVDGQTTDDIGEGSTNLYFSNARAQAAVAADITAAIDALTTDAIEEGITNLYFSNTRAQNAVTDHLDTDDLDEGSTNLYFSNARALAAVVDAITGGTQTNITVTYDSINGEFDFVAENGVADSTTNDLTEGANNLYFTNARAVSALEAVVPNFTEVDVNDVATHVAATLAVATASQVTAYDFAHATYRSGKFIVKAETGSHSEVSEILITLDNSNNVSITEYAMVGTNGNLFSVTADVSGADVRIRVTTTENNTDVTVVGTLIK